MESTPEDLPRVLHEALLSDPSAAFERDMLQRMAFAFIDEPQVWFLCKAVLKQHRCVRDVEGRVKMLVREMQEIPSIGGKPSVEKSVSEIWDGAPVSSHVFVPPGYEIAEARPAIERVERRMMGDNPYEKRTSVSLDPVVITRRIGHMQSRSLFLELQFRTEKGWHSLVSERDSVLSSRKIVDLGSQGLPVGSDNALEMVSWIRHFEQANRTHIPIGYASSSLGWQGDDENPTKHGFMCGTRQLGGNGKRIELEASDGDMMEAKELRPRGSFEAWKEALYKISHFSAVRVATLAALAAPLIAIVEGPNGVVEWAGRTSTGKSTVLKVAQSCWRSASSHMATWNTTIIGIEAAAQFLCDLPLIIDDTSAAVDGGRSQSLGKVIYQLVSGRARGRATRTGGQRIRSKWRTLVLATGETPLGELAKAEGASARVLTFWSAPLGKTDPATGALVSECMHALSENCGHAGPRVVQWLWEHQDRWDDLRGVFAGVTSQVRTQLCTPAAARLAEIVALLECAGLVANEAGCLPWDPRPIMQDPEIVHELKRALDLATTNSDRAYDAWEYIMGVAQSRPKSWIGWGESIENQERDPPGGWLGYQSAEEFAWFPQQLRQALQQGGFVPEQALRAWKDLQVLVKPDRGRYTSSVRPGISAKKRLIRVTESYPGHESDGE